ncbi:MAG TPA: 4-hydroxyphenylacetate 3-hydroxylase family protein, partial [Desulfatiglandales bacterium]|nr:4-hydroxyphenylacetate 3-hydroxylase family protein [Desulfatiglandales bacterium]
MKTAKEYIDSLRDMNHEIHLFGERVKNPVDHPIIRPTVNCVAATYELAHQPDYETLLTATSHLTGKKINRFCHIHQSPDDLVNKSKMGRALGAYTGSCFQRCVGMDALNALSMVTYDIDQKHGTDYNKRFLQYLSYVQEQDLVCCGAMTDAKADRNLRPSQQPDPDQYLHVVEEKDEGIIVRGAKLHQTGAVNSHEIIVMPTRAMREDDQDYAISFALPADAEGIIYIYGRQSCDTRKTEGGTIDTGNTLYGGQECMVVFEDVLVPWDRVFMYKEWEFAGDLVEKFAAYHRQSYACKSGIGDVLIGATQLIAEYQGTARASHIREKILEMIHLNETLVCGSLTCAHEGHQEPSGTYFVNQLWANVSKLNVTRLPYEIARLAQEVAGGIMVTMPSEKDLEDPTVGRYVAKYLKGVEGTPVEHRIRILRLIENITLGTGAVCYLTESMHGAGSPQAQKIMIGRTADINAMKEAAKRLCGIVD